MPKQKIIQQGAEAKIILTTPDRAGGRDTFIIKDRIPKSYRLKELDEKIRKRRTKAETKLLNKASEIINSPTPLGEGADRVVGRGTNTQIKMPYIDGKKLSEHLDKFPLAKQKQICKQIGESVAKLHDADIIHGDLTTSNMILVENPARSRSQINKTNNKENSLLTTSQAKKSGKADFEATNPRAKASVFFIDFGLGFQSHKYEDKAVDIHLLRQALEAKHFKHWQELFDEVLKGYKKSKDYKITLERLKAVEKRGRYKH